MSEHLTATDLVNAGRAIELLLTPLDNDSVDHWRSDVNRTLSALLRADTAGFILPGVGGPVIYSDEHDAAALGKYPEILPPLLPDGSSIFPRSIELGVSTNPELWGDHFNYYLKSAYHNEFALANDADDALTAVISLEGDHPLPIAGLHFWHSRTNGRRFGSRESALMRMVFPAMKTGIESQLRWGQHRADLLGTLDGLSQSTAVFDAAGRALHVTPTLQAALLEDPQKDVLEETIARLATRLGRVTHGSIVLSGGVSACGSVDISTNFASYRVSASLYRSPLAHSRELVLVALQRTTPILRSEEDLRALYGFSKAESRVAVHLVSSRSSADIARDLCVTVHTVRRHTEKILLKAQVRSRAELARKVLR